jgi:hypothetical protein
MKCEKSGCKALVDDDELPITLDGEECIELCKKHRRELKRDESYRRLRLRMELETVAVECFFGDDFGKAQNAVCERFEAETALLRYVDAWLAGTGLRVIG